MWTSAFGTLYATLLPKLFTVTPSNNTPLRGFLLHPITLNLFCFTPPIGLAVTQIITSTNSAIAWSNLVHTQFALIDILTELAQQWAESAGKVVQSSLLKKAGDLGALFLEQKAISQTDFQKNAWTCMLFISFLTTYANEGAQVVPGICSASSCSRPRRFGSCWLSEIRCINALAELLRMLQLARDQMY